MILSNKRTIYAVANEDSNLKLVGEVTIAEDKLIRTFNGGFNSLEESTHMGGFMYNEAGETCNKSLNGVPILLQDKAKDLLDTTIAAIKAEL